MHCSSSVAGWSCLTLVPFLSFPFTSLCVTDTSLQHVSTGPLLLETILQEQKISDLCAMDFNSSSPYPEGVISFLDTDLYKLTMQCAVFQYFRDVPVTYAFTNRTPDKKLSREAYKWLEEQITSVCPFMSSPSLFSPLPTLLRDRYGRGFPFCVLPRGVGLLPIPLAVLCPRLLESQVADTFFVL